MIKKIILDNIRWDHVEYLLNFTMHILSMIHYTNMDRPCLGEVYDGIDSMIEKMKVIIVKDCNFSRYHACNIYEILELSFVFDLLHQ